MLESKKTGRPTKRPTIETLDRLYSSMTAKQIADEYKVSVTTVRRWIRTYREQQR